MGTLDGIAAHTAGTWADLKDVPEAEREPTLRSCRSGARTTSQRALKDLGGWIPGPYGFPGGYPAR